MDKQNGNFPDEKFGDRILKFNSIFGTPIEWGDLENKDYAMWLPCQEDKNIYNSPIISLWNEIYVLCDGYWSYIAAGLLKALKKLDEKALRVDLPERVEAFAFLTEKNIKAILSLSKEKGIRFHFSPSASFEDRKEFL